MKSFRLSLFLLLLTQIVVGQNRTVQKDALIRSRGNNNQPINFSTNKNLYPPKLGSLNKNALYEINDNKIKFYVFENLSVSQNLIANLQGMTPLLNTVTESNDIYLDQNQYGIKVLRSGEYEYKTYIFQGKQRIITFEAILDVIPKDAYYFDFPSKNTSPKKDCYDTLKVDGKKALLTFQTPTATEPTVEWLKTEDISNMQRIKKITNEQTLKPSWSFDLRYTEADKDRIGDDKKNQIFLYKLSNINTVFRLNVSIGFGCKKTYKANKPNSIFIPPYVPAMRAKTCKQPNSTDVDVMPPS